MATPGKEKMNALRNDARKYAALAEKHLREIEPGIGHLIDNARGGMTDGPDLWQPHDEIYSRHSKAWDAIDVLNSIAGEGLDIDRSTWQAPCGGDGTPFPITSKHLGDILNHGLAMKRGEISSSAITAFADKHYETLKGLYLARAEAEHPERMELMKLRAREAIIGAEPARARNG